MRVWVETTTRRVRPGNIVIHHDGEREVANVVQDESSCTIHFAGVNRCLCHVGGSTDETIRVWRDGSQSRPWWREIARTEQIGQRVVMAVSWSFDPDTTEPEPWHTVSVWFTDGSSEDYDAQGDDPRA